MSNAGDLAKRVEALEIQITHQDAAIEALNQVITAQWRQIDMLMRELSRLTDRIAAAEESIPVAPGSEPPPPHY